MLVEQYDNWLKSVGTGDKSMGQKESNEWVALHFDMAEFVELFLRIQRDALASVMLEGDVLALPFAIFYYTFRFATFLEAEKYTPDL